ncbi:hypothetical protein [Paraburkholderia sp. RL17-337-BIB-A]|uniref:hypothetical protein n=1 Tax=Paraburkholderia sp. RL17-337-BIB-A TaxID=3031636 RepID=UPI0038B9E957
MLGLINGFADGFVATPVIEACRRHSLFEILDGHAALTMEQLALATRANDGQLRVAMRLLLELDWVEPVGRDTYRAMSAVKSASRLPADIGELMHLSTSAVFQDPASVALRKWLERSMSNWGDVGEPMAGLLTGALLSPLLVQIDRSGGAAVLEAKTHPEVSPASQAMLRRYFEARGWGSVEGSDFKLNGAGQYLLKNGAIARQSR